MIPDILVEDCPIRYEVTKGGESTRRFYDLELVRDRNALFVLSWTAIHPIDQHSLLFGATSDLLKQQPALIVVSSFEVICSENRDPVASDKGADQ
jgi:hypothetical protein